jgi:hypothetical protein
MPPCEMFAPRLAYSSWIERIRATPGEGLDLAPLRRAWQQLGMSENGVTFTASRLMPERGMMTRCRLFDAPNVVGWVPIPAALVPATS